MSTGWHAHLTADIDHGYIGVGAQVSFESYRFDSFSWSETGKEYLLAVWHFQVISARKFFKFFPLADCWSGQVFCGQWLGDHCPRGGVRDTVHGQTGGNDFG